MELISSYSTFLFIVLCGLGSITRAQPTANSINPQPNNQLSNGDHLSGGSNNIPSSDTTQGQFHFSRSPNVQSNPPQPSQTYQSVNPQQQGYQPTSSNYQPAAYGREVQSAPFFGLASNGEFQLSAYFSQLFWGFVGITVTIALILYIIRQFYPSASLGGVMQKFKDSGAARSIDLDRLTNVVYGALNSYGKWATTPHLKTR